MRRTLALLLAALATGPVAAADVTLAGGWAGETLPGMTMSAAYLQVRNDGDMPVTLVAATSPAARQVTVHRTRLEDGISRMEKAGPLTIAPGETLTMRPGGLHLMVAIADAPLRAGEALPVALEFADGTRVTGRLPVRRPGAGAGDGAHEHHHHH